MKKTIQPNIRPIDRFSGKEIKALEELESQAFSEFDKYLDMRVKSGNGEPLSCKDIQFLFTEDKCRGYIIEDGTSLRGYLIYEVDGDAYRIRRLLVSKDHRKQGWGKTLLDYLFEKSVLHGKKKIITAINEAYLESVVAFLAHQNFSVKLETSKDKSDFCVCEHGVEEIVI